MKFFNHDGIKFLNLTDMPMDLHIFYKILESTIRKSPFMKESEEPYVWIHSKPHNRIIFETIAPLLSTFSTNKKNIFIRDGCLLTRGDMMECLIVKKHDLSLRSRRRQFLKVEVE